jgi:hypothetical protein
MTPETDRNIDWKLGIALVLIVLAIVSVVYYATHREITDPQVLIAKTIDASEDITAYRFALSTNLSVPAEAVEMMSGGGYVDYTNKKLSTTMTMMNRSFEMIVINDTAYARESNGSWRTQEFDEQTLWKGYDQLEQQRALLQNATNVTMQKEDNGWVLTVIPDREEVIEQMQRTGLELTGEEELKDFTIIYWIEKGSYYITRIENTIEVTMNIQGLVTPIELNNSVRIYDYNKEMEIEAPV